MSDRLFPDKSEFVTPGEVLKAHGHDFTDEIPASDSLKLTDCLVTAKDDDGIDVSATIISGKKVTGTNLTADLAGFTVGKNYLITYKAVMTTSGDVRDKYTLVKCRSMAAVA